MYQTLQLNHYFQVLISSLRGEKIYFLQTGTEAANIGNRVLYTALFILTSCLLYPENNRSFHLLIAF